MSEAGRQTPGMSNTPQTTNEVSFRTFWARFAMPFVVASALVVALVLFCAVVYSLAVRGVSSRDVGLRRVELAIVLIFGPVAIAAAVLWMRDGMQKLTKTRVLNLEHIGFGHMAGDLFDRFRGGEDSGPLRRAFAWFLASIIALGVATSVLFLPAFVALALFLLVKGEGVWAAVTVLAFGAATILALSVVPLVGLACLFLFGLFVAKLLTKLRPPSTMRPGSSPDEHDH
jgi:hypothetical protein